MYSLLRTKITGLISKLDVCHIYVDVLLKLFATISTCAVLKNKCKNTDKYSTLFSVALENTCFK